MNSRTRKDLDALTETIKDVASKPFLKSTLIVALTDLGHDVNDAKECVNQLYSATVH